MARLGELLVAQGLLTSEQLDRALRAQVMWGARLGTNLIELGFLDLDTLSAALAQQHQRPAALARHFEKVDRELQRSLHPDVAEMYTVLPLVRAGARKDIVLATSSPLTKKALARVADELAVEPDQIILAIAAELRMRYQLERVYNIQRPARFMRSPGKTIPPFPVFTGAVEPGSDSDDAIEIPAVPQPPVLGTYTAQPSRRATIPPSLAPLLTTPVPTVDEGVEDEDENDIRVEVDAPVPPIAGLPFTTPSLPVPGVVPVVEEAVTQPVPAPVTLMPRTSDAKTGAVTPPVGTPTKPPVATKPAPPRSAKPIPSILRPKLEVVEPAPPAPPEPVVEQAAVTDPIVDFPSAPVLVVEQPLPDDAPPRRTGSVTDAWSTEEVSETIAINTHSEVENLDTLSSEVDDALSIPHAVEDEQSSGRDRRRYIRTIDAPSDAERASPLGRIAIRRVAVAKNSDPTSEGNTLGEATRAIRRATNRDRVAELCIDTLFRFAPSCAAAALLVVRGQVATTWKGFIRDGSPPPEIAVPLDQPGLIPKAVHRNATVRAPATDLGPIDQLLLVSLAQKSGELVIVPISIEKQVMCVFALVTDSDASVATTESVAAGAGAAFARLMRDASR